MLKNVDLILKNAVRLVLLTALGAAGWFGYRVYHVLPLDLAARDAEIAEQMEMPVKKIKELLA